MKIKTICIVFAGMCVLNLSCSRKTEPHQNTSSGNDKPVVYTVNYPLAYFAERIGGDLIEVKFPAPADEDPAYWNPTSEILQEYQQADLILCNGAGYAKWMETVSLPVSKCVNTSFSFQDQYIKLDDTMTHSHGPKGQHAHGGAAFTTWLDFSLAAMQAKTIKGAFIKLVPDMKSTFEANYATLEKDLIVLDENMKAVAENFKDIPIIVSHPVYQYWAKGYGLNVKSVHWEPDEAPTEQQWQDLKVMLKDHPSKWMIWEDRPMAETVDTLNSMQMQSVIFDPCGAESSQDDFLHSMQNNIRCLKAIQ